MNTHPDAPADTRMMGIVHSALRRDLVRAKLLLEAQPAPPAARRQALSDHVLWCMDFLHHHHTGEDEGLYPMVVEHHPAAAELVADMDRDHEAIAPAIEALEEATRAYRDGAPGQVMLDALAAMDEVLVPHLEREELEMMPVVSASITNSQWEAWTKTLEKKGLTTLAFEGHWLLDGLDEERAHYLVHRVPAVPRFVLVHLLGRPYRRVVTRLWAGTPAAAVRSIGVGVSP